MRHAFRLIATVVVFVVFGAITTQAHRSGCHRWHSCPSDRGTYTCGDIGYCSGCPDNKYCQGGQPRAQSQPQETRTSKKLAPSMGQNKAKVEECAVVAHWAAMVTMHCPAGTPPRDIAKKILSMKEQFIAESPGKQVHFYVFSDKERVPKNIQEFQGMSDSEINKLLMAGADFNLNTNFREFRCKRSPKKKLGDCSDLLK